MGFFKQYFLVKGVLESYCVIKFINSMKISGETDRSWISKVGDSGS